MKPQILRIHEFINWATDEDYRLARLHISKIFGELWKEEFKLRNGEQQK